MTNLSYHVNEFYIYHLLGRQAIKAVTGIRSGLIVPLNQTDVTDAKTRKNSDH